MFVLQLNLELMSMSRLGCAKPCSWTFDANRRVSSYIFDPKTGMDVLFILHLKLTK